MNKHGVRTDGSVQFTTRELKKYTYECLRELGIKDAEVDSYKDHTGENIVVQVMADGKKYGVHISRDSSPEDVKDSIMELADAIPNDHLENIWDDKVKFRVDQKT